MMTHAFIPITLFAFFLAGCCSQKNWIYQEVISDFPQFDSKQLTHHSENEFNGFEVQFLKGEFGILGFLNARMGQISSDKVVFQIGGIAHCYQGILMEGSQRMKLSNEATLALIQALLEGETIQISMGNLLSPICVENFSRQYKKFYR